MQFNKFQTNPKMEIRCINDGTLSVNFMKIIYWISTSIISLGLLLSAGTYFFHEGTIEGVKDLGFPDFFRVELAILKIIAVIVLLVPVISSLIKEWAYAGIALFYLTAIIAHLAHGDSFVISLINVLMIVFLVVSNYSFNKIRVHDS